MVSERKVDNDGAKCGVIGVLGTPGASDRIPMDHRSSTMRVFGAWDKDFEKPATVGKFSQFKNNFDSHWRSELRLNLFVRSIRRIRTRLSAYQRWEGSDTLVGPLLEILDVHKQFGSVDAVRGVSLTVAEGEFLTFLGPSGCGKTTMLRMIAGFETPTKGRIRLDGSELSQIEPYRRPVGMVFQNLALFPHLNVFENVAFGMRVKREAGGTIRTRVGAALDLVDLAGYEARFIHQLSGGQRQRVALARSLVLSPRILLLDEPLGSLDLKLRRQLQSELKELQRRTRTTFLFVTHDQEEAMAMSDRIAVFRDGVIDQVGAPVEVYTQPKTRFVADFVGETNLLKGRVIQGGIRIADLGISVYGAADGRSIGENVWVSIRPEQVSVSPPEANAGGDCIPARLISLEYVGMYAKLKLQHAETGREIRACSDLGGDPTGLSADGGGLVSLRIGKYALLDG